METNKQLRPVEAYFLMSISKHETWSPQQALAIALYYLYDRGVIAIKVDEDGQKKLESVESEILPDKYADLRDYEQDLIVAISDNCLTSLFEIIKNHSFSDSLLDSGHMEKQNRRFLFLFHYQKVVLSPFGESDLVKLIKEKADLFFSSEKSRLVPVRASIYPSLPGRCELLKYFQEVAADSVLLAIQDNIEEIKRRELLKQEILFAI